MGEAARVASVSARPATAARATAEAAAAASPLSHVASLPPAVLFHGTADSLVAPGGSVALYEELSAAGIPAELHLMAGADHNFDTTASLIGPCTAAAEAFLGRYVINPRAFAEEQARTNPFAAIHQGVHA